MIGIQPLIEEPLREVLVIASIICSLSAMLQMITKRERPSTPVWVLIFFAWFTVSWATLLQ